MCPHIRHVMRATAHGGVAALVVPVPMKPLPLIVVRGPTPLPSLYTPGLPTIPPLVPPTIPPLVPPPIPPLVPPLLPPPQRASRPRALRHRGKIGPPYPKRYKGRRKTEDMRVTTSIVPSHHDAKRSTAWNFRGAGFELVPRGIRSGAQGGYTARRSCK
uniref:Uncharacterized protein n=2 Tax=Cacopsylla melanoneura TaxID=428564 RepID=A0A8D8M3M1_9HEMI